MVQKQVPAVRAKRVFTEEFKVDAVRLVSVEGDTIAAAAKSVGVGEPSLGYRTMGCMKIADDDLPKSYSSLMPLLVAVLAKFRVCR